MTTPRTVFSRLLDRLEHLLWHSQDARLRAAGWDVIRVSRWRRQYRHPHRFAALRARRTSAARRANEPVDDAGPGASLLAGALR